MAGFAPLGSHPLAAVPPSYLDLQMRVDSAAWTGIEVRLKADPAAVARIEGILVELDGALEETGLTNAEKAQAKAMSEALLKLVRSPEPEWKVIARLLIAFFDSRPLKAALNAGKIAGLIWGALKLMEIAS